MAESLNSIKISTNQPNGSNQRIDVCGLIVLKERDVEREQIKDIRRQHKNLIRLYFLLVKYRRTHFEIMI